jgi:hypothetical protein
MYFQDDVRMTSQFLLYQLFNSVLLDKLQDTQSINFSFGGTFSDVMSERSDHHHKHFMRNRKDVERQIESTLPIIKGRTRFFIVKSFDHQSIQTSIDQSVWSTSAGPTKKLKNAYQNADHVILIFSVNESRSYQGFARMESEPDPNYKPELFMSTEESPI